jgi:homospermidine synthase
VKETAILRRVRQFLCRHNDTYEEWTEVDRRPGLLLDNVTRLRTLWRCNACGKEVRRARSNGSTMEGD